MRFRKLAVCMLIGMIAFCFTGASAYAAEGTTENQNQEDITAETLSSQGGTDPAGTADQGEVISSVAEASTSADVNPEDAVKAEEQKTETSLEDAAIEQEIKISAAKRTENAEKAENSEKAKNTENTENTEKTAVKKAAVKYTKSELRLLSALVFCEAQGESYNGKLAVAIVVMNRVRSSRYPDTVKDVIYQKYQFSPVRNGSLKRALAEYDAGKFTSTAEKACIKAAKAALSGERDITISGKEKDFSKYLSFSGGLRGYTYRLGNHKFK